MTAWWSPGNRRLIARYLREFRPYAQGRWRAIIRLGGSLALEAGLLLPLLYLTMRWIDSMVNSRNPAMVWHVLNRPRIAGGSIP